MGIWHLPTSLQSARALCDLNPSTPAVGRGAVLQDPGWKMDQAIREAEEAVYGR
ncbi:MAG TPA: hypothetical protein VE553_09620 [Candidatus Binatia bacterium]|nr:hypothetical protein [Candidatus Binatia bacterium]